MVRGARLLAVALLAAGCSGGSATTYDAMDVGQPIDTTEGRVVSSRLVAIEGEATGRGFATGMMAGAVFPPVAILTAGIGHLVERRMGGGDGIEYVVAMVDGRTVTLVQEREDEEEPLPDGTPVLVQQGALYSRVLEHPDRTGRTYEAASDWVDPDTLPPDSDATSSPPSPAIAGLPRRGDPPAAGVPPQRQTRRTGT